MTEEEIHNIYLEYARQYRNSGDCPTELYGKLYYRNKAEEYMKLHHEISNKTWTQANEEFNARQS